MSEDSNCFSKSADTTRAVKQTPRMPNIIKLFNSSPALTRHTGGSVIVILSLLALWAEKSAAEPPAIRGMSLGHHSDIPPQALAEKLTEIRDLGATHVTVVLSWSTRDVRSNEIAPRKGHTPSDAKLAMMIDQSHRKGLKVLLFPLVDVRKRKPLEWRGTIKPNNWDAWWEHYRRFVLHYADLAQKHRADVLCVGSELVSTESMRQRWEHLIRLVRQRYSGQLLYSANWDHYEPVSFWDLVDLVGLTAYYRLTTDRQATTEAMEQTWREIRGKLLRWARRTKRPFLFTEVGYPSLDGGAVNPWDYTQRTSPDPDEQLRAYRAFISTWSDVPQLAGVFFWDWYGEGGPRHTGYTPRNKPAEHAIRAWFRPTKPQVAAQSRSEAPRN